MLLTDAYSVCLYSVLKYESVYAWCWQIHMSVPCVDSLPAPGVTDAPVCTSRSHTSVCARYWPIHLSVSTIERNLATVGGDRFNGLCLVLTDAYVCVLEVKDASVCSCNWYTSVCARCWQMHLSVPDGDKDICLRLLLTRHLFVPAVDRHLYLSCVDKCICLNRLLEDTSVRA
jgi:hypothetical protein